MEKTPYNSPTKTGDSECPNGNYEKGGTAEVLWSDL